MRTQHLVIGTALALSLAACGSSDSESGDSAAPASVGATTSVAPPAGSTSEVVVQNYTFPAINATPGATLSLVDLDDEAHTVTADDGSFASEPFNSKEPGALVVPSEPGNYAIHCEIHPTMKGTLVVGDGSATQQPVVNPETTVSEGLYDY